MPSSPHFFFFLNNYKSPSSSIWCLTQETLALSHWEHPRQMKLQQNMRLVWVRFLSLVALCPIPLKNLQVTHPYQPPSQTQSEALGFPDLLVGRHYDISVCPWNLWRIMPQMWRRKGFLSFPDLPRFLPLMFICLRYSPYPWENYMLIILTFSYWFCSVYMKTAAIEACDLHNHLEMFPVLFWVPIWLLALVIQAESGNHPFPTT